MYSIQFDPNTEKRLVEFADHQGLSPEQLIQEAVIEYLAELNTAEDAEAAYQRYLAGEEKTLSLEDIEKRLDLEG
jgi:predicted DNA-binding protein